MVNVALDWKTIKWLPDEKWKTSTLPKLNSIKLKLEDLKRSVYVIRLNGEYCVDYPKGQSPTLYIGEGNFKQRIESHREWIKELKEFVGDFAFEIRIAVPRVTNNENAYKDCEAAIIIRFGEIFGSAPLWNKQFENRRNPNYVYNEKMVKQAICMGSGKKYKWAFKPLKSSPFYLNFKLTHYDIS